MDTECRNTRERLNHSAANTPYVGFLAMTSLPDHLLLVCKTNEGIKTILHKHTVRNEIVVIIGHIN